MASINTIATTDITATSVQVTASSCLSTWYMKFYMRENMGASTVTLVCETSNIYRVTSGGSGTFTYTYNGSSQTGNYYVASGTQNMTIVFRGLKPSTTYALNIGYATSSGGSNTWIASSGPSFTTLSLANSLVKPKTFTLDYSKGGYSTGPTFSIASAGTTSVPHYAFIGKSGGSSTDLNASYYNKKLTSSTATTVTCATISDTTSSLTYYYTSGKKQFYGVPLNEGTRSTYWLSATVPRYACTVHALSSSGTNCGSNSTFASDLAKSGLTYKGLASSSSSSTVSVSTSTVNSTTNATTSYYAVYSKDSFSFKFYGYNGSASSSTTKSGDLTNDLWYGTGSHKTGTFSLQQSYQPTVSGKTLLGWAKTSGATTADFSSSTLMSSIYTSIASELSYSTTSYNLYAVWEVESHTYTITYDANGGSGAPSPQSVTGSGTSLSITLSNTKPTRSGRIFIGWSTSSTATSASYYAGNTYSFSANTTLYAVWGYSYTITYNPNGGSYSIGSETFNGTTTSSSVSCSLNSSSPTYSGRSFEGWGTSASSTSASYQPGNTYSFSANTTIYAIWGLTITYNANSGSGAPSASKFIGSASSLSCTLDSKEPTRSGYSFLGWSTNSSATSASYNAGSTYSFSSNTTLYAVWQKVYSYTITYNANGGSNAPSSQTYTGTSSTITGTVTSSIPTKSGRTFIGWTDSSSSTNVLYEAGDSISLTANKTLYAVWAIYVNYDANGGSGAPSRQELKGNSSTISGTLSSTTPTRTHYTFRGWGKSSTTTTVSYNAGSSVSNLSADLNLYAIWGANVTYTLSFNLNGGSGSIDDQLAEASYGTTSKYTFTVTSSVPTRTNYVFAGWGTSASSTSVTVSAGGTYSVSANSTATLYALWKPKYVLKYNKNTTDSVTNLPSNSTYESTSITTSSHSFTISSLNPSRDNYEFLGWSTSSTATSASYLPGSSISVSAGSTSTLYAVWKFYAPGIFYGENNTWKKASLIQCGDDSQWKTINGIAYIGIDGNWYQIKIN